MDFFFQLLFLNEAPWVFKSHIHNAVFSLRGVLKSSTDFSQHFRPGRLLVEKMNVFLVLCLLFAMSINPIASELRCQFIDNNPEIIQLNCDTRIEIHSNDNCTMDLFGENARKTDLLKVNSVKIGSCQRYIEQNWDMFTKKFKNIEDFDVSLANADNLPPSFWKLTNMKQINASHNELRRLPIFASAIRNADFAFNNIHDFHVSLRMPIESLNLSHNHISSIGRSYQYLTELQTLDLSYNEITTISSYLLDDCPKLKFLNLENNQIRKFSLIGVNTHLFYPINNFVQIESKLIFFI